VNRTFGDLHETGIDIGSKAKSRHFKKVRQCPLQCSEAQTGSDPEVDIARRVIGEIGELPLVTPS
jgi:hypothetical protein